MKQKNLGVSGVFSALLTVLLLVSGFAVSTGLLSAIYVSQAEVMRRAVNVGEAVAERLQAFVYNDVQSNRTLLTVRNVGSTGSEVEYLMAVGHGGEVLREARLDRILRLGVQQHLTIPLADLLGPEFDNYTRVRSVMATLYLKTAKGGVFGSGYMAPPSVMTAAYATSTTTLTTEETHTETLRVETGSETIASWTATVILENPSHWPVESYVGVAFAQNFGTSGAVQRGGFPDWGLHPGLMAKDSERGDEIEVTSADSIRIPFPVTCTVYVRRYTYDGEVHSWGWSYVPVRKFSEMGPTYIQTRITGEVDWSYFNGGGIDLNGGRYPLCEEIFEPRGTTLRHRLIEVRVPGTAITGEWTGTATDTRRYFIYSPQTTTISWSVYVRPPAGYTTVVTTRTYVTEIPGHPPATISWVLTTTGTGYLRGAFAQILATITATRSYQLYTITGTGTATETWVIDLPGHPITTIAVDSQDMQTATFPSTLTSYMRYIWGGPPRLGEWRHIFRLSYIKVVDLWNTTNVLAYVSGDQGSTIRVKVDRPVGLAAVYVFSRSEGNPPPPPTPPPPTGCIDSANICQAYGYGSAIRMTSSDYDWGSCDQMDGQVTVTFQCNNPNDNTCGAWIAPGPGTYTEDQVQPCPKDSSGKVTCTVPAGSTIIAGQSIMCPGDPRCPS